MSHEQLNQVDFFLANPPLKPKEVVADYVERAGMPVPKRYVSLQEALSSDLPFIIRSEHPQDYAGASDLLESIEVDKKQVVKAQTYLAKAEPNAGYTISRDPAVKDRMKLYDHILATIYDSPQNEVEKNIIQLSKWQIELYCQYTNNNVEAFEKQVAFSYWKLVDGIRQTVAADSAIKGRYHIFTECPHFNYCTYENGVEIHNFLKKPMPYVENAISLYESVRELPQFGTNSVPVMEMVTNSENTFFLQYLRGRQFSPPNFSLEGRELKTDEVGVEWIRGITSEDGIICSTRFWYKDQAMNEKLLSDEEASFDFHFNWLFSELMTSKRRVQFMKTAFMNVIEKRHLPKSKLFKPEVSAFLGDKEFQSLIPELGDPNDHKTPKDLGVSSYEDFVLNFKIISDGRRAVIKRVY